jgi:glycine cleavage system aminomethyltransferase T
MFSTPLQEALRAAAANRAVAMRSGEYRGAETAAGFSDPQMEFEALRNGCGVYDLGFRARISLTGGDRARWMNGMVTNNIRDLAAGRGVYAFLLNPQGRILGDMLVYNEGETLDGRDGSQPGREDPRDLRSLHHHGRRGSEEYQRELDGGGRWQGRSREPS